MSDSQIAKNPSAWHDYNLFDTVEAGVELKGSEVKSIRATGASLRDAFARVDEKQIFLYGLDIRPYAQAGANAPESKRVRKLLLHRAQIDRLGNQLARKGFTLVATRLYFKGGLVKVEIAVAQGKKAFDKRDAIQKRDLDREIQRTLRSRNK